MSYEWVKPAVWGAIGGAAVAIVVGFSWGGWVTGGGADEMVASAERKAEVATLATFCVDKAMVDPEYSIKFAAIKAAGTYDQDDLLEDAGWATLLDSERPNSAVADKCLELLMTPSA